MRMVAISSGSPVASMVLGSAVVELSIVEPSVLRRLRSDVSNLDTFSSVFGVALHALMRVQSHSRVIEPEALGASEVLDGLRRLPAKAFGSNTLNPKKVLNVLALEVFHFRACYALFYRVEVVPPRCST